MLKNTTNIPAAPVIICAAAFFSLIIVSCSMAVPPEGKKSEAGWKEDFNVPAEGEKDALPDGWVVKGKPGTRKADFSVVEDKESAGSFLHMEADDASASLLTQVKGVSLKKYPALRWRWRADVLPKGADGREKSRDDQAIGLYVGADKGGRKSVSYRWDTDTPVGSEGECAYGFGTIKVKWYTLRNKDDALDKWFVEERDYMKDFVEAWGFYPEKIYLSVSCNSQYTGTEAAADLDWIELVSPDKQAAGPGKEAE